LAKTTQGAKPLARDEVESASLARDDGVGICKLESSNGNAFFHHHHPPKKRGPEEPRRRFGKR